MKFLKQLSILFLSVGFLFSCDFMVATNDKDDGSSDPVVHTVTISSERTSVSCMKEYTVTLNFSGAVDPDSLNADNFSIVQDGNEITEMHEVWSADYASLDVVVNLDYNAVCTVEVEGNIIINGSSYTFTPQTYAFNTGAFPDYEIYPLIAGNTYFYSETFESDLYEYYIQFVQFTINEVRYLRVEFVNNELALAEEGTINFVDVDIEDVFDAVQTPAMTSSDLRVWDVSAEDAEEYDVEFIGTAVRINAMDYEILTDDATYIFNSWYDSANYGSAEAEMDIDRINANGIVYDFRGCLSLYTWYETSDYSDRGYMRTQLVNGQTMTDQCVLEEFNPITGSYESISLWHWESSFLYDGTNLTNTTIGYVFTPKPVSVNTIELNAKSSIPLSVFAESGYSSRRR